MGWNLVGYPARDDATYKITNFKADTGATIVEVFNGAATYKTQVAADSLVMSKGRAYWAYVPSDTTWTVNW